MKIILSQRIDIKSDYEDIPYFRYHFPKRYRNQICPGDQFIYYQGNRFKKEQRYYFGCGVIGAVEPDATGNHYYAEILEGMSFKKIVPIYLSGGKGFIESIGYEQVRQKPIPSWQNSIRKISESAFSEILKLADIDPNIGEDTISIEEYSDPLKVLREFNRRFEKLSPTERAKKIQTHLDRGMAATKALKSLLGAKCQICGWMGFTKRSGDAFIEAHHLVQLHEQKEGSLCTENVILVCPNCHREIHHGKNINISTTGDMIEISLSFQRASIHKNTIKYLETKGTNNLLQ
jgi:hypothetical protein